MTDWPTFGRDVADAAWRPAQQPASTRLGRFMGSLGIDSLEGLQHRATADPAWFWGAAADDIGLAWQRRPTQVLDLSRGAEWARWWTGGAFNYAALPHLWLGQKGRMTTSGITQVLRRRGRAAGVDRLHPHLFRHTYAHEALSAGMQEGEVMALAGWRSREMLSRYAKSAERERAIAAARRVNVGDRL
jgi:hypothetical protein